MLPPLRIWYLLPRFAQNILLWIEEPVSSTPQKDPLLVLCISMHLLDVDIPFILLGNGNGSSTKLTTNPFTLVVAARTGVD